MRHVLLLGMGCVIAVPLFAQGDIPTSAQGDVAVTIYQNGQSLVQDSRQMNLPSGRSKQEFPDVSAQIRAETVTLTGPGIGIVEQNFDYDLLTPAKLMEKAVGQTVTLLRTNVATGVETRVRAKVLAANGGVVLQIGDSIEVLRDDGLPVRVIFDRVPPNLRARPTLSVTVESKGGLTPTTLTYLTPGLGWTSDYVTLFDDARQTIDVQGWVTLTNNTGTDYANADVLLVAGNPNQGGNRRIYQTPYNPSTGTIDEAGTESNERERLGDYYLYPLGERTTIANAQQKQVSFLDIKSAPARNTYEFNNGWLATNEAASASSVLKFSTSRSGGLGDQLPSGTMRVYMRDKRGDPQFIGESRIEATPMGSAMSIRTGESFDVKVKTMVEERTRISSNRWKTRMRYEITNARGNAITVDLGQNGLWGDVQLSEQSQEGKRVSADRIEWSVPVPANGKATVTATFDSRY
ncbi:DUF4139 domain-containing protein [Sphingorhabdus sp. IMCC26285]|uniref:DUF4139 domain-containing protein n=1 Tax=Sphingorhabdus profundilacus TaxID=2509718 RepID=A0A6I4LZW9_9SPHN|nr:DUF4139 domain-containing protein [Sphingorhabdus profundilacus]MVZ97643.1 DUF4139 domain-containing protein [Sphingorhabdus profundilacus]